MGPNHSKNVTRYVKKRKQHDEEFHRRIVFQQRKYKRSKQGIEFTVNFEDIPFTGVCPVLGVEMSYKGVRGVAPSLDRIDVTKGYVPSNVRWVCHQANRWKNDMKYEDLKKVLDNFHKIV